MRSFFLDKFENAGSYKAFIVYMLLHSDSFSLVYFKYQENEKMKSKTRKIFNDLKNFKMYSKNTKKWPNTETFDESHIYKIIFYRSKMECLDSLTQVSDIYDWDYPNAPMDLCFYRQGYCWLAVTAHEHMAYLYTDNETELQELRNLGANLTFYENDAEPFYCERICKNTEV